jgi:hypothetical protein
MAESTDEKDSAKAGSTTDAAVVQIREVIKWLIAAFAAVGVALAAGSQLSEIGDLGGLRLLAALGGIVLTLAGISVAIIWATKVLTPKPVGLKQLAASEDDSEVGEKIREDPSLLLGHGKSIREFEEKRQAALAREDAAWTKFEAQEDDTALAALAKKASADRMRIDEAMSWLFSFARYTETARLFRVALRTMIAAAVIAAIGIAGFAWAAHPEEASDDPSAAAVVPMAPAQVEIDLSAAGKETLKDDLGEKCDTGELEAVALAGTPDALEVVTVPSDACELQRFVLTTDLGTFKSAEPPPTRPPPAPPVG